MVQMVNFMLCIFYQNNNHPILKRAIYPEISSLPSLSLREELGLNWEISKKKNQCPTWQVPGPELLGGHFQKDLIGGNIQVSSQQLFSGVIPPLRHRQEEPLFWGFCFILLFFKKIFIYLASPGLSCGMRDLVPWPGMEPRPPALGAQSLSHCATREAPEPFTLGSAV